MMFQSILYYLTDYWSSVQDPRTKHLFTVDTHPLLIIWLFVGFNVWATKIGPALMANRPPFQLKKLMLVHNITMAILNCFAFINVIFYCDFGRIFLDFKYPDRNDFSEDKIRLIHFGYYYYLTKYMDLLDTNFFIARKKWDHISFLHLYHHTVSFKIEIVCYNI